MVVPKPAHRWLKILQIPEFDIAGTLPAFHGNDATALSARSPYSSSMIGLVERFSTSAERAKLLLGLNGYRKKLFQGGFQVGVMWIDGSFVEDVERFRGRAPRDIDILSLFHRPIAYQVDPNQWADDYRNRLHAEFFETKNNKPEYHCDTYGLDLDGNPSALINWSTYWFGLFSEQRGTSRKKGIVQIPLANDPAEFASVEGAIKVKFDV